jgi:hypothetical protein
VRVRAASVRVPRSRLMVGVSPVGEAKRDMNDVQVRRQLG